MQETVSFHHDMHSETCRLNSQSTSGRDSRGAHGDELGQLHGERPRRTLVEAVAVLVVELLDAASDTVVARAAAAEVTALRALPAPANTACRENT